MCEEELPLTPELKKEVPYRKVFRPPYGYPPESFRGWVMERIFRPEKTPRGWWFSIMDYMKFDDGSRALRFWYQGVEDGKVKTARGMFLREDDIEALKNKVDNTFAIKALLKKFIE